MTSTKLAITSTANKFISDVCASSVVTIPIAIRSRPPPAKRRDWQQPLHADAMATWCSQTASASNASNAQQARVSSVLQNCYKTAAGLN